ncbi:MAG TPA: DinB family protein [Acidimicrobiales bacterium]|nr:DinB family protein [Acidimicrobiales bacterium]
MPTRESIRGKLAAERAHLLAEIGAMSADDLGRPCTDSEAEDGRPWSAKDHLAHLAHIERSFQGMIERHLRGDGNPVGLGGGDRSAILGRVHRGNEDNVDAHRGDDLPTLLADLEAARADSLRLLDRLSDEQLASPLPGAPWADGTIGGVLITNAYHEIQHLSWVRDGLAGAAGTGPGSG